METAEPFPIIYSLPTYQIKTLFESCSGFADNIQKNFQLCDRADTREHQYCVISAYHYYKLLHINTHYTLFLIYYQKRGAVFLARHG